MQAMSASYETAVRASPRRVLPVAEMDFSDPDAVLSGVSGGAAPLHFASSEQLFDHKRESEQRIITLEEGLWLLTEEAGEKLPGDDAETAQTAYAIDALSDENCEFGAEAYIELAISGVSVLQAMTIYFADGEREGWPVKFSVSIKIGGSVVWEKEITENSARHIMLDGFTVHYPDAVRVTFHKWSWPHRRPRVLEIMLGAFELWTGADIYEMDIVHQTDFSNLTVAYDTASISVRNEGRRFYPRAKQSIFNSIEARQPVKLFYKISQPGGPEETVPAGVMYLQTNGWEQAATGRSFTLNFTSIVGLLAERTLKLPEVLPQTVQGWVELLLSTLGANFSGRYEIADGILELPLAASADDVNAKNCGMILRYICMAVGCWYGCSPTTGNLTIQAVTETEGDYIPLSGQFSYPEESAADEYADVTFKLADDEIYTVGGGNTDAGQSLTIDNPFIRSEAAAKLAAVNILRFAGGSRFKLTGRGNPASELGDVDTFETIFAERVSARRYKQQFKFNNGVMLQAPSWFLQGSWAAEYGAREEINETSVWTAPEGVSRIRLILIGHGADGEDGEDGSWSANGDPGAGGAGGKVWVGSVNVTAGGNYAITIDDESSFAGYSSANGVAYDSGWGDIYTGLTYAAPGTNGKENCKTPQNGADGEAGTGNGGQGGSGGRQGARAWDSDAGKWRYKRSPADGGAGGKGASGCVIIYYDKAVAE